MGRWDDEDWVGTPPEGRHTRDRARPAFWAEQQRSIVVAVVWTILFVLGVIVLVIAL
jgi:hypothetical protein